MRWLSGILICFLLSPVTSSIADVITKHGKITLVHARATATAGKVRVQIHIPAPGEVLQGEKIAVSYSVHNWAIAPSGKHLHAILDNDPIVECYDSSFVTFENVKPGAHVIRIFPVYEWHESVKQQEALAMVQFYVGRKEETLRIDADKPMLIYSTPVGTHDSEEQFKGQPHPGILVDWFLWNVSMGTRSGYLARISVDGEVLMSMKEWRPHYLQNLSPGKHRIKLELTENGTPVPTNWSITEREITVR